MYTLLIGTATYPTFLPLLEGQPHSTSHIFTLTFDGETRSPNVKSVFHDEQALVNPSWLELRGDLLLAGLEHHLEHGSLATFRLDRSTGAIKESISRVDSGGIAPGYACFANDGRTGLIANYLPDPAIVTSYSVDRGGRITNKPLTSVVEFAGASHARLDRREGAHGHFVIPHPKHSNLILVADLGADVIKTFILDSNGTISHAADCATAPGAGPRQLACHPTENLVYVLYELSCEMAVFEIELPSRKLIHLQTYDMVAPDTRQSRDKLLAAAVRVSKDGRFLYASMRNDDVHPDGDCITVFSISEDGRALLPVQHARAPHGGWHIRDLELSPDGDFVATGTMASGGEVLIFARDGETGKLFFSSRLQLKDTTGAVISPAKFLWV